MHHSGSISTPERHTGYDLLFDKDLVNVISQTGGDFLSQDGADTQVSPNTYDNTIGKATYEETRWE
jgi:hypothetical protein